MKRFDVVLLSNTIPRMSFSYVWLTVGIVLLENVASEKVDEIAEIFAVLLFRAQAVDSRNFLHQ